jgi:hypothetical protein
MAKLLHITSDRDGCIDECLIVVPDEYDEGKALVEAENMGVDDPAVETVYALLPIDSRDTIAEYRPYVG